MSTGPGQAAARRLHWRVGAFAVAVAALGCAASALAQAEEFRVFSSQGLPRSQGVVVRVGHPPQWRPVLVDDEMALAELRGPQGRLTGILQIGRGRPQRDMAALCQPARAATMLQNITVQEPDARVTDVVARRHGERAAYELRYERNASGEFMRVHSLIVCLKDSRLVVSCAGLARSRAALADIEPVCRQVLESLAISEE